MVNKTGKVVRIVAIVMIGMTAAMNLLGGIGTTCAAFSNNVGYRMAFIELMDYRWLYQILVVTTILVGLAGIWATFRLVRGSPHIYRDILIILVVGTILGGVQYFASMALRGKAAPANVKFYLNVLTLVLFLVFRLPGIWNKLDLTSPGGKTETRTGVGLAAIVIGLLTLTIFMWAGPSHTFFNQNWTYVLFVPLILVGSGCTLWGVWLVGQTLSEVFSQEMSVAGLDTAKNKA
jgi:hypothetical protein